MNRLISFACIVAALASLLNGFAAGLIVVEPSSGEFPALSPLAGPRISPPPASQPSRVIPPGHPMPHPHRAYPFAPLHLNLHKADITIRDQIASVAIEQEFYNPNPHRLEGTFLFPLPRGAQIKKFAMEIGGKSVEAELLSAEKARQIYEDIVRKMRDPALMEYAGRELIRVRIFPIEPNERKRVTLAYTQLLRADSGLVEFAFPLNTGKFSQTPVQSVSLKLDLETGRPLKTIYSPSHSVEIKRQGSNRASLVYEAKNVKPDSDFQLYFTAEHRDVGIDIMTYRTGLDEGFFLLFASPGMNAGEKKIIPKDVAFVLDTSGSMAGKKLDQAKKALQFCVENLNDGDRFEVLRFAAEVEPLFNQLVEAGTENRAKATAFIKALKPIGGTAIDDALKKALTLRGDQSSRPFVVIFLTDGLPTVGVTNEDQIVAAVNKNSGSTRVFCFGIGHDVNTHLLDRITESTRAASQYVVPEEDIEVKVSNFFTKIKEPVLANLKIVFPESVRVTKLYPSALPDLFKGEQLVLAGRYAGCAQGQISIEGMAGGATRKFTEEVKFPDSASEHDFIPRLWATRRVGYLLDEMRLHGDNKELRDEVTELARQFGIVTPYTAYLIVEDEKQRGVPLGAQSLPRLQTDARARELTGAALDDYYRQRSGGGAVAGARYGLALKQAEAPVDALKLGNAAASESLAFSASPNSERRIALNARPSLASPTGATPAPASDSTVAFRVMQHTEQTRFVNGKSFFQNGSQWIDAKAQKMPNAQRVRVQFNSREYFELAANIAEARPWLAIGQNVQFVHDGKLYEVYE